MTIEEFAAVTDRRIPTPKEFVAFVGSQDGWRIVVVGGGQAALRVPSKTDPLAVAVARMLSREPWRTEVLNIVSGAAAPEPQPAPVPPPPAPEPDAALTATTDPWGNTVLRAGSGSPARAVELIGSERGTCAYRRFRLDPETEYRWEEWQDADRKYPPKLRVIHPDATIPVGRDVFADLFGGGR